MLTTFYPPYSFGGDAIGVERLAKALARRGYEITVIHDADAYRTLAHREPEASQQPDDIKVIPLRSSVSFLSNVATHQFGRPVVHGQRIQHILDEGDFDVIWYHNISLIGGPGLLSMGRALKIYEAHEHWLVCPTHVLWRHNKELCDKRQCFSCVLSYQRPPQFWRQTDILHRKMKNVDAVIAKSEFSRQKHKEFGFRHDMKVVPYFLPDENAEEIETEAASPHDRPYFLFVGRLEKIKGLDDVFPAFERYPDADLVILGDGEYGENLRRQAEHLHNVKFLGRLTPDELSVYYKHAIALIVPSVCYETFGIILIESFRKGTPVIARHIGPFPEIVEKCGGGVLFSNETEMVDAMKLLHNNPLEREKLSQAARQGFYAYWSEKAVVNSYVEVVRGAALAAGNQKLVSVLEE